MGAAYIAPDNPAAANDPRAWRMASFGFVTHNVMVGTVFGSYGVLLTAVEAKMHVTRDVSSLGIPLVMFAIALGAPVVGWLLGRFPLRLLMATGALLIICGFALLSVAQSVPLFLVAYAVLLGPAMSLNATFIPTTLVTRWFDAQRGRALGFVNMPLLAALMPPLLAYVMTRHGLSATYAVMAALGGLLLLVSFFVIDRPPADKPADDQAHAAATAGDSDIGNARLLRSGAFWGIVAAFAALAMSASVMSAHVVPLAMGWGISATSAAALLSFSSIAAMFGSGVWGVIAERLGGARVLGILCLCSAGLWLILLLHPAYMFLAVISALMGFTSGAMVPVSSLALSQLFGRENFARAYGLCNLLNLPALVLGVPVAAHIYVATGSYSGAMMLMAALGTLGMICALLSSRFGGAADRALQREPA
jgi:MFS family permease